MKEKRRFILVQLLKMLFESVKITTIGISLGILISYAVSMLIIIVLGGL